MKRSDTHQSSWSPTAADGYRRSSRLNPSYKLTPIDLLIPCLPLPPRRGKIEMGVIAPLLTYGISSSNRLAPLIGLRTRNFFCTYQTRAATG
jgi:hypothetical protein